MSSAPGPGSGFAPSPAPDPTLWAPLSPVRRRDPWASRGAPSRRRGTARRGCCRGPLPWSRWRSCSPAPNGTWGGGMRPGPPTARPVAARRSGNETCAARRTPASSPASNTSPWAWPSPRGAPSASPLDQVSLHGGCDSHIQLPAAAPAVPRPAPPPVPGGNCRPLAGRTGLGHPKDPPTLFFLEAGGDPWLAGPLVLIGGDMGLAGPAGPIQERGADQRVRPASAAFPQLTGSPSEWRVTLLALVLGHFLRSAFWRRVTPGNPAPREGPAAPPPPPPGPPITRHQTPAIKIAIETPEKTSHWT
ncbi:uncharacterized protein LOC125628570 [Caretta caretta]|uniref:uncharacterized protein LOC125628570 n=1 Tax=Caretta caretta TaxID=8467 RepID=UPI003F4BB5AB